MGIRVTDCEDVLIKGCSGDIKLEDSNGVVKDHKGGNSNIRGSEFQIVSSEFGEIRVDNSTIELYDTIAKKVIKETENGEDPVIQNLNYFAQRTIEAQSAKTKAEGIATIVNYVKANEDYLNRLGHLATLDWVLSLIG